jgi:hypothetical protein
MAVDARDSPWPLHRYSQPAAVLDLVGFLFYDFAARRSKKAFLPHERMGKQLFAGISPSPTTLVIPSSSARPSMRSMPRQRVLLVDRGMPKNLVYARSTAKAAGKSQQGTDLRFQ